MTKAIHNYTILTIDKDGKEKRVKAVAKDIYELIIDAKYLPMDEVWDFFMDLMCEGQAKLEDHSKDLDHVVWAD